LLAVLLLAGGLPNLKIKKEEREDEDCLLEGYSL
jgi:hypothetical protein